MQNTMTDVMRLMTRRTRSGQSIIIIALGFIVLIAFVGIATDAALLFVRFSTLRRAVDAAAVAAAGQIRENTSYAQVAAAAQQYIKLHGLDPGQVLVETCETEIENLKRMSASDRSAKGAPAADNPAGTFQAWLASNNANGAPNSELCRKDPSKLVRVTALIESPTTFLSVLGYGKITLAASSISQTAVMDVVLMLDTSLSMAYDTSSMVKKNAKGIDNGSVTKSQNDTYLDNMPGFVSPDPAINGGFSLGLQPYTSNLTESEIPDGSTNPQRTYIQRLNDGGNGAPRRECRQGDPGEGKVTVNGLSSYSETAGNLVMFANYAWAGCCNDPSTQTRPEEVGSDPPYGWAGRTSEPLEVSDPRFNSNDINWFIDARTGLISKTGTLDANNKISNATIVNGKADGNYSDLLCRPFKDVRDATRRFLLKVDFTRGDRVILIQFDSSAKAISRTGYYLTSGNTAPIFTSKSDAINALNRFVGVEVNPGGFSTCPTLYNISRSWSVTAPHPLGNGYAISADPYRDGEFFYETIANCADTNTGAAIQAAAALLADPRWIRRDAVWIAVLLSDGYPNRTPGLGQNAFAGGASYGGGSGSDAWNPNIHVIPNNVSPSANYGGPTNLENGRFFDNVMPEDLVNPGFCPWRTLCDPHEGSDSQHAYYNGGTVLGASYSTINRDITRPPNASDLSPNAIDGYYSSHEWWKLYCETVTPNPEPIWWDFYRYTDTALGGDWHEGGVPVGLRRPISADNNPDTRHFCVDRTTGNITPGRTDLCSEAYDADDFARDRTDFAALIDYTPTLKGNFIAMFSIFFPHVSSDITNTVNDPVYLRENILGVKFMRYVADAGDNGIIDNPLQAWYRDQAYKGGTYVKDPVPPGSNINNDKVGWDSSGLPAAYKKTKDPCFDLDFREKGLLPVWDQAGLKGENPANLQYENLARQNCGNYYYAGNATSIDRAFTDIASRLFTRLSR